MSRKIVNVRIEFLLHDCFVRNEKLRTEMSSCHSVCYEELGTYQHSSQRDEKNDLILHWLREIPDFGQKDDMITSSGRAALLNNNSSTSYLEEWEDASLFEALQPKNRFSGMFCCFKGIFNKSARANIKIADTLEKPLVFSEDDWDMLDI